jgi:hypothetical protein
MSEVPSASNGEDEERSEVQNMQQGKLHINSNELTDRLDKDYNCLHAYCFHSFCKSAY